MATYTVSVADTTTAVDARSKVIADSTPPILTPISPVSAATNQATDTSIVFDVQDFITGVNFSTVEIHVNGDLIFSAGSSLLGWTVTYVSITNGYRFFVTSPNTFAYGTVVTVRVVARDNT